MKYPENIKQVGQLLPDYMGFIFWENSSRSFDGPLPHLPKTVQKVGVFVDASLEEIVSKIKQYGLNLVQLHGNESPEFCLELKKENIQIIKVFSVNEDFDFNLLKAFETVCDFFLLDTKGEFPGGNGVTFNWEILNKYDSKKTLFLSGGIGIQEIKKITQLNFPIHAIDINSKFEVKPGFKNKEWCRTAKHLLEQQNKK